MNTGLAFKSRAAWRWSLFAAGFAFVGVMVAAKASGAPAQRDLLTADERAWLTARGPLRYAPDPAFPPFEFIRPDGQMAGITPDLLEIVAQRLGTSIRPVRYGTWAEAMDGMRRGEADLLGTLTRTPDRERFLLFSKPYLEVMTVLFVNKAERGIEDIGDLAGRRVAVVKEHGAHAWLAQHHPEVIIETVASSREGLLMLSLGRVDAHAEALPVGRHVAAENSLTNLRVLPEPLYTTPQHLAVAAQNPRLLAILQKGLDSITEAEHLEIRRKWGGLDQPESSWRLPVWVWWVAAAAVAILMAVFVRDIAKRKRAEQQLQESELLYHSLVAQLPQAIFRLDRSGRITFVNSRYCQMIGHKKDELLGKTDFDLFPRDLAEKYWSDDRRVMESGKPFETVDHVRTPDGREMFAHVLKSPLRDADGRVVGLQCLFWDVTEQEQAAKTLRRSEANLAAAQRLAHVGSWEADLKSLEDFSQNPLWWSDETYRIFGYEPRAVQVSHELFGKAIAPEDRPRVWTAVQAALRGDQPYDVEHRIVRPDGSTRIVHEHAEVLRDPLTGRPIQFRGTVQDITERKQTEDALRASQQRLALHVEQTPLGVIEWDLDFKVTAWNSAAEKIFGFLASEAVGRRGDELIVPPSVRPQVQPIWEALLAQRGGTRGTNENITKDGRTILCEWYNTPLVDSSGQVIAVASLVQDVTERHRTEQALRESEERYRLLAEHSDDFVSLHDEQGNRLYVSPSYYRVTGWTPEEIYSTDWRIRMHPDDLAKVERAWAANLRGESNTIEHRIRCKDGSWIWVESRRKAILGPDGKVRQVVLWAHDITERKNAEGIRDQLEAQLRQAQKMEAIGQLAGGIAHDFNNILTVILGNAHLLDGDPSLPPAARDKTRQLIKSAERAAALTRQLLAFSRRQVVQLRRLDLNEVLANVSQMLNHLIGEHIQLQCNYGAALPPVEADAGMMEQVIVNLAVNARDAMPDGGRLTISTSAETITPDAPRANPDAHPGCFVTLTVSDTGCGMDETVRSHLFEPFFTTKEVGRGTGLGLAMTYGIIRQHNGWIEAESQPHQGATFRIFLPVCPAAESAPSTAQVPSMAGTVRGHETILVVEDEEPVRQFIRGCLENHGYRVLTAADADEAWRAWETAAPKPDLLLTDIVMPGSLSGRELAAKLRKARPGLKVILSSGYSREIAAEPGELPSWICLPKPYDPISLVQIVRRCLDGQSEPNHAPMADRRPGSP